VVYATCVSEKTSRMVLIMRCFLKFLADSISEGRVGGLEGEGVSRGGVR